MLQVAGYEFLAKAFSIFALGPHSHSGFLKINAINRTFTHTTQIQLFDKCDLMKE